MSLPRRKAIDDWSSEIEEAAATKRKGKIVVYKDRAVLIPERAARIQHVRATTEFATSTEWNTKRFYRFQISLQPNDPPIPAGSIIRVTDGGKDHTLILYVFEVLSAANSSEAALRTIETVTSLKPAPPVTP